MRGPGSGSGALLRSAPAVMGPVQDDFKSNPKKAIQKLIDSQQVQMPAVRTRSCARARALRPCPAATPALVTPELWGSLPRTQRLSQNFCSLPRGSMMQR